MHYVPENPPEKIDDVLTWLFRELERVSSAINSGHAASIDFLHVAPVKPREGMLYGADGADWNPGSGKGVYCYYGTAWHYLG